MEHFSKWLIAALTPWNVDEHSAIKTWFELSNVGIMSLMKSWDNRNAIKTKKKQQFRSIQTIFHRKSVLTNAETHCNFRDQET